MIISSKPYYTAYENRYKSAYEAGAERWGHSPDNMELAGALAGWVAEYKLAGKLIIEFACGEGASGVILTKLGCSYHGIDIAPSAVEKARSLLKGYSSVNITLCDMVRQPQISETYDAALDVSGLHMLVTDSDRSDYLNNAFNCLKKGASMLFFSEGCSADAYEGPIAAFDEWLATTGVDIKTPQERIAADSEGNEIKVYVPLLLARPRSREGYIREMTEIGFIVDDFIEMKPKDGIALSASIYVHKP
jgi:hypothetical protein